MTVCSETQRVPGVCRPRPGSMCPRAVPCSVPAVAASLTRLLCFSFFSGEEERGYDSSDLARFAIDHGLQAEDPEMIYKSFVDLRVGTADDREAELAKEKLAAGVALKVEDR